MIKQRMYRIRLLAIDINNNKPTKKLKRDSSWFRLVSGGFEWSAALFWLWHLICTEFFEKELSLLTSIKHKETVNKPLKNVIEGKRFHYPLAVCGL